MKPLKRMNQESHFSLNDKTIINEIILIVAYNKMDPKSIILFRYR